MRRWNGWGDDTVIYPLAESARRALEKWVGPAKPPQDATLAEVCAAVPPARLPAHPLVTTRAEDRVRHARGQSFPDWLAMRSGRIAAFPDGVAYPATAAEVQMLLNYAQAAGVHVIPYGGGTSVVGHINPLPGEAPVLTIDLARMNRLIRFDESSRLATFGAGINGPDLEAQLRARGCTLGHFPQSFEYSTLGGWIASRSSGQQSLGYGRIERLFAGGRLETPVGALLLPDHYPASAAGPDLKELVLGSEGRFGVITEATVRAVPLPEHEEFQAVFMPDFQSGRRAAREIVQTRLPLSMIRLSTAAETETTLAMAGHEWLIGSLERLLELRGLAENKCMLILGFTGAESIVGAARKAALSIAEAHRGIPVGQIFGKEWHKSRFRSPYLRNALWEAGYGIDTLETAADWARIPVLVDALDRALRHGLSEYDEWVHVFTHLSHLYPYGSSIYTTYLFRLSSDPEETFHRWQQLKRAASEAIVMHGGTISHQHGIGVDHAPYLPLEKGPLGTHLLGDLSRWFDPQGMMNPGKLLDQNLEKEHVAKQLA